MISIIREAAQLMERWQLGEKHEASALRALRGAVTSQSDDDRELLLNQALRYMRQAVEVETDYCI